MQGLRGGDLGFVPTMGAFHEGHLSLMGAARGAHERVCVSLFVNPLQFGPGEDLSRYPRAEARDFELAESVGVDIMFAPGAGEMFSGEATRVYVPGLSERWEGAFRPGHFDGVATVVAKLFGIAGPATAYFGWKDLQQCLVIRRMVTDLSLPVKLEFLETIREEDGLAKSSRNAYLSPEERAVAPEIYATLREIADSLLGARAPLTKADLVLEHGKHRLEKCGFAVDYLELVDREEMEPLRTEGDAALIVAARLGTTRLIDNVRFTLGPMVAPSSEFGV